jgi:hypothetical protein
MNDAKCHFCKQTFRNRQAVRAHLRHCKTYRNRRPTSGRAVRRLPIRRASLGRALPEADEPQAEFDASEDIGAYPSMPEAQSPPHTGAAEFRALLAAQERRRQEEAAEARKQRRREIAQRVKDRVIGQWWSSRYKVPAETKARALMEIERVLSGLAVDELPEWELVQIAEGVREKHYGPVMRAQDDAQRQEERRRLEEQEQAQRDADQRARGELERRRAENRRSALLEYGVGGAREALQEVEDLDEPDRERVLQRVEAALAEELTGEESKRDVAALVNEVLDEELGEAEDDDGDDVDEDDDEDDEGAVDDEGDDN